MTPDPPVRLVRQFDTHRLIPSRHLPHGESVLAAIAEDDAQLRAIVELESATNDRLHGEQGLLPGIGPEELLFGVPYAHVVNASFCHANPLGSRFNGPDRGAWYAGFELETSQAEVAFHKSVQLAEINRFEDSVTYDDYEADLSASFHDLRHAGRAFRACLDPSSYVASQELAERLLADGSLGIVYPSVRHRGGTCVVCFRPALVQNVRKGRTYRFTWSGTLEPKVGE
ncbi:MAG: RES family NAD+ phosphorylase [Vicinamibacterales bacterium]